MPDQPIQTASNLEFLTPKQVAVLMQVRETTVTVWLRRGLLRGVKIGHTWRIPQEALARFTQE